MTALMNLVDEFAFVTGPGVVEREPDIHLEPDVLVFPRPLPASEHWKDLSGHWLAVEVYSRGSRKYNHDYKRDAYLALGVREVWLVDMDERVVLVSRADGVRDERVTDTLRWHPPELAEELVLPLEKLFADL
jgi:Uma2 family endonuclease